MTDIIIQGIGGRMGHVLCEMIAQREDCRVIAGIDVKDGEQNGIPVYDSLEKLDGKGDVVIDFSSPAAVEKALPYCEAHKLPIVVCTTGLSEELQLKIVQLSRSIPVNSSQACNTVFGIVPIPSRNTKIPPSTAPNSSGIQITLQLILHTSLTSGENHTVSAKTETISVHRHPLQDAPVKSRILFSRPTHRSAGPPSAGQIPTFPEATPY